MSSITGHSMKSVTYREQDGRVKVTVLSLGIHSCHAMLIAGPSSRYQTNDICSAKIRLKSVLLLSTSCVLIPGSVRRQAGFDRDLLTRFDRTLADRAHGWGGERYFTGGPAAAAAIATARFGFGLLYCRVTLLHQWLDVVVGDEEGKD